MGEEEFVWSGSTVLSPGYTAVYEWHAIEGEQVPVECVKGQTWDVEQVRDNRYHI